MDRTAVQEVDSVVAAPRVHRIPLWQLAALAFVAMCANDILLTIMVVKESHYGLWTAGIFDVFGWVTGLICSALAIEEIIKNGWRTRKSLTLIGAISAANYIGTFLGVLFSK